MADGIFSFLRQDPNQMPQRTFMSRLGSAAAILNPMNPMASQYGQMMDARLQDRRQEYTRNKSIEELQRRAQGGDKLAERYLSSVQTGALQPGQAFGAYYQQMASEDQFRRQQAAVASREQAVLRQQAEQAGKVAEYLRSNGQENLADMVLAYPQMANNVLQSLASTQLQPSKTGNVVTAEQLRTMFPGEQIADGLYNLSEGPDGLKISKVGGAGSQTTIQMPGELPAEEKLREELMTRQGKDFGAYLDAGSSASQVMTDLRILQEIAPLAPSGPLSGRLAEAFPDLNDVSALRQSIVNRVGPSLRVEGSGSTSDIEFNAMINSLGSLRNTPEANQAIIAVMMEKQQFNLDRANIVRQYTTKTISLDEANRQIAALESQSRIPSAVEQILSQYRGDNTGPKTSAPKVRTYNPITKEFE